MSAAAVRTLAFGRASTECRYTAGLVLVDALVNIGGGFPFS